MKCALHIIYKPTDQEGIRIRGGRRLKLHVPDDVTALEAARFAELLTRFAFDGPAEHVNLAKSIEAYGLNRLVSADDYDLEYVELPDV